MMQNKDNIHTIDVSPIDTMEGRDGLPGREGPRGPEGRPGTPGQSIPIDPSQRIKGEKGERVSSCQHDQKLPMELKKNLDQGFIFRAFLEWMEIQDYQEDQELLEVQVFR